MGEKNMEKKAVEENWGSRSRNFLFALKQSSPPGLNHAVLCAVLADNALQALAAYSRRSTRLDDTVNSCITVPISISEEIMKRL